jgi:hypothetical protein
MEQIILYAGLFCALVVNAVDGLSDWLKEQGIPLWLLVVGIIGFHAVNKWSIEFAGRVEAIEKKLGIRYTPPVQKKSVRWSLLAYFVVAVYVLGKSIQSEGLLAPVGIIISCLLLLVCAFCAYCFIDQLIRAYWRRERETREESDC